MFACPGLWVLFCLVVCVGCARMWVFGFVYQVISVSGRCPFSLVLGEVLSVFRFFWGPCLASCVFFFGGLWPFGNIFLFIQKKKKLSGQTNKKWSSGEGKCMD